MSVESSSKGRNSAEERAIFDISGINHAIVHQYQPGYHRRGGESLVYEIPNHNDIVAKASVGSIKAGIDSNLKHLRAPDVFPEECTANEELLQKGMTHFQNTRSFFGKEHVPNRKQMIIKVPITEAILKHIYQDEVLPATSECWALVTVQKKVSEITKGTHISAFSHGYPDWTFEEVLNQPGSDSSLKEELCNFLEKMQRYTLQTGELLDIWGEDNVAFFKKDGHWTYSMIDVLYEDENADINLAKNLAGKFQSGGVLSEREKSDLFLSLRYVLNMYTLGERLGIENKLPLVPGSFAEHLALFNRLNEKTPS